MVYHCLLYHFSLPTFLWTWFFLQWPPGGVVFCTCFYFALYEVVHLSCHLEEDHWWLTIPGLKAMRHHHRIHHHPRLMNRYNFCIVYPLFDYVFGTKYKEPAMPKEDIIDHYKDVTKNID